MRSTKYLLLIFSFLTAVMGGLHAQKNYETAWKKINELLETKYLPQSALTEVKKIYAQAKKEGNDAQLIKSLVYMTDLQEETREDNIPASIIEIEKEIATAKEPASSILKSYLAQLYFQYLQDHRYQLYQRTNTTNFIKTDISTWTIEDLHKKISSLYLQSIRNEPILKQTKLQAYEPIIVKGNARTLRPTLYDLLAHEALDYFRNDERDIKKPAYAFEIEAPQAFLPAAGFISFPFTTKDSLSLQHKALVIYQQLLSFHIKDENPAALIDADIERIRFVFQKSVNENKDSLYIKALESLAKKYEGNAAVTQAKFLIAQWMEGKAAGYDPLKDTTYRYYRKQAAAILSSVVKDSSAKNEGWTNSYNLLQAITRQQFSFALEKVNLPALPFRALVTYKNIGSLSFRIIRADETLMRQMEEEPGEKFWSLLQSAKPLRTWTQTLPATGDLQEHRVEIKIDALPVGEYYLLSSLDAQGGKKNKPLAAQRFHVSNISYVSQGNKFFVLHRETGQPLANAAADLYSAEYNAGLSKITKVKLGTYTTNANGFFIPSFRAKSGGWSYSLDIRYKDDRLWLKENQYYYFSNENPATEESKRVFFFTDRSIYRPGQTVYFKGIAVSSSRNNNTINRFATTVYLRDANDQVIDSLRLTTNEFGSFNGKFQLPQNTLNGNFSIVEKDPLSFVNFSVEEYKRPKFSVGFDKLANSYKVNETISLTGTAKAYAGNNIEGATVSYRVVRQPRFIYTWYFRKIWQPNIESMEIAHGETTTDKDGKFIIHFTAIPDKMIDAKLDPLFDYKVYADVTDINGETRSGNTSITAAYKSLILHAALPSRLLRERGAQGLSVRTENMNGVFQSSPIQIKVYALHPEQRLIRERLWEQPDQFVMDKAEYMQNFPHDEYKDENDQKTWPRSLAFEAKDSSRDNHPITLPGIPALPAGYYAVEITAKDKDVKEIKEVLYTELYDLNSNAFSKPEYLWTKESSKPVEPGQNTTIQIGSSASGIFLVGQVDQRHALVPVGPRRNPSATPEDKDSIQFYSISGERKSFSYEAREEDRGGYGVNFFFIKDNRLYQFGDVIDVPWSNKDLQIDYATFRDKTLPGSEEKWKVTIKGNKHEVVAAEMLASMYDASLDQFRGHQWAVPRIWQKYAHNLSWSGNQNFVYVQSENAEAGIAYRNFEKLYDALLFWMEDADARKYVVRRELRMAPGESFSRDKLEEVTVSAYNKPSLRYGQRGEELQSKQAAVPDSVANNIQPVSPIDKPVSDIVQPRKNFNETAFFFPDLRTDKDGSIEFSFTIPEALTRWKLQTLAHTADLAFGFGQKEMVTQKQLMVQPNMPRFLRQGDHLEIPFKIVNLSDSEMTGQVQLELIDASTNQPIDGWFMNTFPNQYFTVAAKGSEIVKFPVQVPVQFNKALVWRVTARSGHFTDGEEDAMPVLSNKVLVTETVSLPMKGIGSKNFSFDKLKNSGNSESLQHQSLTVEYTSNPAWYAVQALPYLMEYPYECAEQTWNRYYANALASKIANSSPRLRQVFERWRTEDTAALLSNLQKNPELKSVLLQETPWVLQAGSEATQKKNIALLFDMVRMSSERNNNLEKLKSMQLSNGGFVWFKGGPDDRYITQYILTGIGHLKKLGATDDRLSVLINPAIAYLDRKITEDYNNLIKTKTDLKKQTLQALQVQYLYMRSFFQEIAIPASTQTAFQYFKKQAQQFWMKSTKYEQGMTALMLHRAGEQETAMAILRSLKENSIVNEELGRYWKDNRFGFSWHWSYAPIETQALLIEAFSEIAKDQVTADDMRTWLIKNKQTNNWPTTKATADACYAMLLKGSDWINNEYQVSVKLGDRIIRPEKTEAGTGYFKQAIDPQNIKPEMGNISVTVQGISANASSSAPSWGAVYWQYFEDMDKVTSASTPLQLTKKLFIERNTDRGPVLTPFGEGSELHVGDRIKVRIELRVDRDMEYVHMKDMRASALEPVNVLSGYRWQGGLGYYESTKDASTNFFFNFLRKGSYVFEYPLFVTHGGSFSNGITTIQCMYAPEFTAHSEGVKINVE